MLYVSGALRSHIAARHSKTARKKGIHVGNRGRSLIKKIQLKGSKRSALTKKKQKEMKEKRDLVSIVPKHRSSKSEPFDQDNDIILDTETNSQPKYANKDNTKTTAEEKDSELTAETKGKKSIN